MMTLRWRCIIAIFLFLVSFYSSFGQSTVFQVNHPATPLLERLSIKYPTYSFHSAIKNYDRKEVAKYLNEISSSDLDDTERHNLEYLLQENSEFRTSISFGEGMRIKKDSASGFYSFEDTEITDDYQRKPILKYFYRTEPNFLHFEGSNFFIKANPVVDMSVSKGSDNTIFQSIRGAEVRGGIDDKVFFYSRIYDNQVSFPQYVNRYIDQNGTIPYGGFYKTYKSKYFDDVRSRDLLRGEGHFGFNVTPSIGVQAGYGKGFIGNGLRSTLLSDFSDNMLYLKLNTNFWRIHYQNIFTELAANSARTNGAGDNLVGKKYMAAHYFSLKVLKNLEVGIYEATVFSRRKTFELQYFNPVILYRTVEHALGSPDNVLLGGTISWIPISGVRLYGQLLLDELNFKIITKDKGWWGNKYALQGGIHYVDAFKIPNLDLRLEANLSRPYTYTHTDSLRNYVHYENPLAHPLGANFAEVVFNLRYNFKQKIFMNATFMRMLKGNDVDGQNYGGNIRTSYNERVQDYGNELLQGNREDINFMDVRLSYQFWHNVFLDVRYQDRLSSIDENSNRYFSAGIRANIGANNYAF